MQFIFLKVLQPKNSQQHTALNKCEQQASHVHHHFFFTYMCEMVPCIRGNVVLPSVPFISSMQIFCTRYMSNVVLKLWTHAYYVLSTLIRRTYVFLFNICCHANVLVNLLNFWKVDRSLFSYLCCNFCLEDNIYILPPSQIISRSDFF